MAITRDDVERIRQAHTRIVGGKPILIRTPRTNDTIDLLEFIAAELPQPANETAAPIQ